jgi:hypothetical protein
LKHSIEESQLARRAARGGFFRTKRAKKDGIALRKGRVCAAGYEATFRSLGERLDLARATSILLVEQRGVLTAQYRFPTPGFLIRNTTRADRQSDVREEVYARDQLLKLVTTSRTYRNNRYYH